MRAKSAANDVFAHVVLRANSMLSTVHSRAKVCCTCLRSRPYAAIAVRLNCMTRMAKIPAEWGLEPKRKTFSAKRRRRLFNTKSKRHHTALRVLIRASLVEAARPEVAPRCPPGGLHLKPRRSPPWLLAARRPRSERRGHPGDLTMMYPLEGCLLPLHLSLQSMVRLHLTTGALPLDRGIQSMAMQGWEGVASRCTRASRGFIGVRKGRLWVWRKMLGMGMVITWGTHRKGRTRDSL